MIAELEKRKVVVVGAGWAGLGATYQLVKQREFDGVDKAKKEAETRFEVFRSQLWIPSYRT